MRRLFAPLLLLAAALAPATLTTGPGLAPVTVTAARVPLDPADPARQRIGRLRYLGGLRLQSADPRFGGLSGLRWAPGGLVAITDGGNWVALDLTETGGRLTGLAAARIGMVRGPHREAFKGMAHADAEALDRDASGFTVAFTRNDRLWSYRNPNEGAWSERFPDPAWLAALPKDAGVAAMARSGRDWQFYAAETPRADGAQEGLLAALHGMIRALARVTVPTPAGFRPTDAEAFDAGRILLLSRRADAVNGDSAAVQLVPVDVAALALGTPETLATIAPPLTADNFEGIALRRDGGRTFIYLVTDDDFSPEQRTLLMKFELLP